MDEKRERAARSTAALDVRISSWGDRRNPCPSSGQTHEGGPSSACAPGAAKQPAGTGGGCLFLWAAHLSSSKPLTLSTAPTAVHHSPHLHRRSPLHCIILDTTSILWPFEAVACVISDAARPLPPSHFPMCCGLGTTRFGGRARLDLDNTCLRASPPVMRPACFLPVRTGPRENLKTAQASRLSHAAMHPRHHEPYHDSFLASLALVVPARRDDYSR